MFQWQLRAVLAEEVEAARGALGSGTPSWSRTGSPAEYITEKARSLGEEGSGGHQAKNQGKHIDPLLECLTEWDTVRPCPALAPQHIWCELTLRANMGRSNSPRTQLFGVIYLGAIKKNAAYAHATKKFPSTSMP
jgi:hypothetical protein